MRSSNWIPLEDERPRPNSIIAVKGFKRNRPLEHVISTNVQVDAEGSFSSLLGVVDTHWQYVDEKEVVIRLSREAT